jgi:hypothetical protein
MSDLFERSWQANAGAAGLVWLGDARRHSHHHIADTRSERARFISTQTGPFHWLHFFPDEQSSVTVRLAATQPVTAAQALESDSWPKIHIYGLPKYPFRTLDRSDDDAEETFRMSSNYAAEVYSHTLTLQAHLISIVLCAAASFDRLGSQHGFA